MFKIKTKRIEEEIVNKGNATYKNNGLAYKGELMVTNQRFYFKSDKKEIHLLIQQIQKIFKFGLPFIKKQILMIISNNKPYVFIVYRKQKWKTSIGI